MLRPQFKRPGLKVLHVIPSLCGGGAERFAAQLVEQQREIKLDARVCIFQRGAVEGTWCRNVPPPLELSYRPRTGLLGRPATITLTKQLSAILTAERPDILHTHLWPACKIASRATRRIPVRHIWHVHDTPAWLTRSSMLAFLQRTQLRLMVQRHRPLLLACSDDTRGKVIRGLQLPQRTVTTIRNGVDTNQFYPAPAPFSQRPGPAKLIMAAAFRPAKGHLCLVEAVELLAKRGIHFELTLAGNSNSETGEMIKREVVRRGLAHFVHFAGQVTDVASMLRENDVFALPSESEGLPLSLLEAMACGLAIVATRVGGIPEIVEDGKTGLLVEPRRPTELAEQLQALIASREVRRRLGAAGVRLVARHFSFTECAQRIVEAYREDERMGDRNWRMKNAR